MKPNILYFVCHDLGRALGTYGAGIPTPHLDRFAASGVRFTNAHCASPACSPSRACAMSGLYAHTSGAIGLSHMGWPLDLRLRTSVDDFNAAGYETILSGINHERLPRTDRYQQDLSRTWDDWKLPRAVDNALSALANRDASRPFYLNVATQEPHSCTWAEVGCRIPELTLKWPNWLPPGMPSTPALQSAFRRFAAAVVYLDGEFGRLIDGLTKLKLAENTLVIFTTDHGMAGPRGKGSLYGLGTEIALLMRQPGVLPAGESRSDPVSNVSFRATLAEAAGLIAECQGQSFWRYALGDDPRTEPAIFLERNFHGEKPWRFETDYVDCYDPIRAVRTVEHLYIRNFAPREKPHEPGLNAEPFGPQAWDYWNESWKLPTATRKCEELYDLRTDPLETSNIADDPAAATVLGNMRSAQEIWMSETADFVPGEPPQRPRVPGWGVGWPVETE